MMEDPFTPKGDHRMAWAKENEEFFEALAFLKQIHRSLGVVVAYASDLPEAEARAAYYQEAHVKTLHQSIHHGEAVLGGFMTALMTGALVVPVKGEQDADPEDHPR